MTENPSLPLLPFGVCLTGPVLPIIEQKLAAHMPLYKPYEAADPAAFMAEHADKIRGLVGGYGIARIDGAYMGQFRHLEIVANFGVGYDGVDAKWAGDHGIIVTNTPDVLTDEVADLALGLLLATMRRLPQADAYVRAGHWGGAPFPLTPTTRGRVIGILGLGRIGKAVARRCEGFGWQIAYHGRKAQPDTPYRYYDSLLDMAHACDVLVIIAPGGAETRHMVSRDVLRALGPQGTLINVARGSLVDETALITCLQNGELGAAGLDVFEREPHVPPALRALENVVLLPHIGSATAHTRNAMGALVADNILNFARGQGPLTPVPETPWR